MVRPITNGILVGGIFGAALLIWSVSQLGCDSSNGSDRQAGDSYFPLAKGNMWVFVASSHWQDGRRDTLLIDAVSPGSGGDRRYHARGWILGPRGHWLSRHVNGDIYWSNEPDTQERPYFLVSVGAPTSWSTGLGGPCGDSVRMDDDYQVVETPYGRFDGAKHFGGVSRCTDVGGGISLARGVGPVQSEEITIAGLTIWQLVQAHIHDDAAAGSATSRVVDNDGH